MRRLAQWEWKSSRLRRHRWQHPPRLVLRQLGVRPQSFAKLAT